MSCYYRNSTILNARININLSAETAVRSAVIDNSSAPSDQSALRIPQGGGITVDYKHVTV